MAAKVHVTGAACPGVTTLGRRLAANLGVPHVDCDDIFWVATDPPFTTKRPVEERAPLLRRAAVAG